MPFNRTLTLLDLPWLRLAGKPKRAVNIPDAIAGNLLRCGHVYRHEPSNSRESSLGVSH